MPKFYFHLTDGEHTEMDDVGADLPDVDAACDEARKFIEEIRSDLEQPNRAFVAIVDERGTIVGTIPVKSRRGRR